MNEKELRALLAPAAAAPENDDEYFSQSTRMRYMSNSQFGSWLDCQARTLAELRGEWQRPETNALLFGKYFHAHFEGESAFQKFTQEHQNKIFKKNGEMYALFAPAAAMFGKIENDPKAMKFATGLHEVVITGTIGGILWIGKIDVLDQQLRFYTDLKSVESIRAGEWAVIEENGEKRNRKVSFITAWDYWRQMAVYHEMLKQRTGKTVPPVMLSVSKEEPPDIELLGFNNETKLENEITKIEFLLPEIIAVKTGKQAPKRCGHCDYCRSTKHVDRMLSADDLVPDLEA